MPANSKAQAKLFRVAKAVKNRELNPHDASQKAVDIARTVQSHKIDNYAETDDTHLPERVPPKIKEYAGINIGGANGQVTMGSKGDGSFFGPDAKMKGGDKRSVYNVPKSSIHHKKNGKDLPPEIEDEDEEGKHKTSYIADRSVPKNSIHNQDFNLKELDVTFPGNGPTGTAGDASFLGKNGMYKGNSRKPIFKTPKSSIHYKKGNFPDDSDFYNKDNWETEKPGPSTDVSGKRKYVGNKSVPKNSIHYDEIPDEDRKNSQTMEQLGIPMTADGMIDGGVKKKKKFADASKYGYPIKEMKDNNEQLLKNIAFELKHFTPGNYDMKGDVEIDQEYNKVRADFRGLGEWIDDMESGQEDYEDNDWRIWAPGEYKKYFQKFDDWASKRPWYKQVKLNLSTSEKDWCEFSVTVLDKNITNEEKDYDTNIVPKTSIHYGERDKVPGETKMKFETSITKKAGFVPDSIKNLKTQGDWKGNLTKAVMDLTGEAQPKETSLPVPIVPLGDTPEFPFANDGSSSYPIPGGGVAVKKDGNWTFGDTPELPAASQAAELGSSCQAHGEPSANMIDIPCSKKPLIKKLMMFIKKEQSQLHEGIALNGEYNGKVVKLNTIYEGVERRFKTYVQNEGRVLEIHFGPKKGEGCGSMIKKKEMNEDSDIAKNKYQQLSWLFKKYRVEKSDIESVKDTLSNIWTEAWRGGALNTSAHTDIPKNKYQQLLWLFKKYSVEKPDIESVKSTLSNIWSQAWSNGELEGFSR